MDLILSALECSHNHECLLCCREIQFCEHKVHPEFEELFTNLFRVFSHYMNWDLPPNYTFNFKTDLFPFCKSCILVLVDVNKLDERIRESLKSIESLMTKASAKILLSEPLKSKKLDAGVQPWKNFGKKYTRQKVSFCRNVTLQRYLPVVPVERPKGPGVSDGVPQEQELGVIEKAGHFNFEGTSSGINVCIDEVGEDVNMPAVIGSEGQDAPPEEFRLFLTDNEADIHGDVVNEHAQEDTSLGSAAGNSNQESTDFYSKYHSNSAGVSTISIWNPYADLKTEVDLHDYTHNSEDSSANGMEQTGNPDADYTFTSGLSEGDNYISDDKTSSVSSAKEDDGTQKRRKKHKFVQLSDTKFEYRGFTFELENGRFKCNHCSYNGNSKSGINSHIITYHIDGDGKSRRIRSNIRYVEVSKNHFKFGDNHSYSVVDGRYLCGHCPLRSVSGENVRQHIRRYHMGMDLSSKTKISESSDLEYNYTKVGDEYKCGECGFLAKQDVTIRGHFRHKHFYNRSKHVCKICGKGFRFNSGLQLHLTVHSKTRPFTCEFCGKAFKCDQSFKNHMKHVHSDIVDISEKKFTCGICGKQFFFNSLLTIHVQNVHSKEPAPKTFTSEICHTTPPTYNKTRRMLAHSGDLHECSVCGKKCLSRGSLQNHMETHGSDKNSVCGMCGVQFTSNTSLFKHMKNFHGMNQIAEFPGGSLTSLRRQDEKNPKNSN